MSGYIFWGKIDQPNKPAYTRSFGLILRISSLHQVCVLPEFVTVRDANFGKIVSPESITVPHFVLWVHFQSAEDYFEAENTMKENNKIIN